MDAAYSAEVLRILEMLRVALISSNTKESERVANETCRYVRSYLTPSGGRGEGR
jgi:hypothetical protein